MCPTELPKFMILKVTAVRIKITNSGEGCEDQERERERERTASVFLNMPVKTAPYMTVNTVIQTKSVQLFPAIIKTVLTKV